MFEDDFGYEPDFDQPEMTKEEWISSKSAEWKEQGRECKALREHWSHTITELSKRLGTSRSTLSRFEDGKPVTRSAMIARSYFNYFTMIEYRAMLQSKLSA